jgi:hypothetical protein
MEMRVASCNLPAARAGMGVAERTDQLLNGREQYGDFVMSFRILCVALLFMAACSSGCCWWRHGHHCCYLAPTGTVTVCPAASSR